MRTLTIIVYRPSSIECSLGHLEAVQHSELIVRPFSEDDPALDTFLELTILEDHRLASKSECWVESQIIVLLDGVPYSIERRIERARDVAERMWEEEVAEAQRKEARDRLDREAARERVIRDHEIAEFKRIFAKYKPHELFGLA